MADAPQQGTSETAPLLPAPSVAAAAPNKASTGWRRMFGLGPKGRSENDGADRDKQSRAATYALFLLVLVLGFGVGVGVTKVWDRRTNDVPMVPPVFKIPPPTHLPRNPAFLEGPGKLGKGGAVASEDKICSELGLAILRDLNGTAVDGAITTTLCIGLVNAFSSGIGGGGFALVSLPEGYSSDRAREAAAASRGDYVGLGHDDANDTRVFGVDFRETAPAASTGDMYRRAGRMSSQVGGLAVGVPGELRGLEAMHRMYGQVAWADLVRPVADLARQWQVSRELARRIRIFGAFMLDDPTWAAVYAPHGQLVVEGDWISRPSYAHTLERIAHEGPGVLYEGHMAKDIVLTVKKAGGIMTRADLEGYKARVYPAISSTFAGQTVYTADAPASGAVMLGMLNILDPLRNTTHCWDEPSSHNLIEAMKFAFGARSEVTDPVFSRNVSRMAEFRTKAWADEKRKMITPGVHDHAYYGLVHDTPSDHGTTHLSVVDRWGGAASVTSTVNLIWGSHLMCPETGIILNDEQDDFAVPGTTDAFGLPPSPHNYPAPGKRPLSSTAPTIVTSPKGKVRAVLGGSGGSRIFPSVAQVLLNLACGLDISAAVERERLHDQLIPEVTTLEVGPVDPPADWLAGLKSRGHNIAQFDINIGSSEVQGVTVDGRGRIYAASDSRKNGIAAVY